MKTLIVYESMFGNTRMLAQAIAGALESAGSPATLTLAAHAPTDLAGYDLVVVGAPTHAHTLPQAKSREEAARWAKDPEQRLTLEESADLPGVREWLEAVAPRDPQPRFAVFSTRADIPRIFAGDAAASITKRLHRRGFDVEDHIDFVVDMHAHALVDGEQRRAREWAMRLVPVAAR